MNKPQGFNGLRVAAFESWMAEDMSRLINRCGRQPLVAPALQEIALEHNQEALSFGKLLLTGVGTHTLIDVLRTRYPSDRIVAAFVHLVLVARGPKPATALKTFGLVPTITVPEPNTCGTCFKPSTHQHSPDSMTIETPGRDQPLRLPNGNGRCQAWLRRTGPLPGTSCLVS